MKSMSAFLQPLEFIPQMKRCFRDSLVYLRALKTSNFIPEEFTYTKANASQPLRDDIFC